MIDPMKLPMHAWEMQKVRLLREITTRGGDVFPKGMVMLVEHTYRGKLYLQLEGRKASQISRKSVELVTPFAEMPKPLAEWKHHGYSDEAYYPIGNTARSVMRKCGMLEWKWRTTRQTIQEACARLKVECRFRE